MTHECIDFRLGLFDNPNSTRAIVVKGGYFEATKTHTANGSDCNR